MHGQLRCRPRLFGRKLHRQLRLRKKNNISFEDDVHDKTQTQFMNKSYKHVKQRKGDRKRSRKQATKKRSSTSKRAIESGSKQTKHE